MAAEAFQPNTSSGAALKSGDKVGSYTIIEQIGMGGSSIVYRAKDELLNRDVAVKQIRLPGGAIDDDLRERVKAEAAIQKKTATATPRHLVAMIEALDEPRGLFLVSEYINGPSLEQVLAQNTEPMDLKQAVGIIAATGRALQDLHNQGVIHRDLKPANILLPRDGGLKISDFGLATAMAHQQAMTVGSVRYMAPELLRSEPADGRADLYALGMIGYEMIAGRKRFDEAFRVVLRDQRNQAMRWMKWHTNPRVAPPPLTQLRPELAESLSQLIARLMDKDPAKRVPSAADLLEAIRRHFAAPPQPAASDMSSANPTAVAATAPGDTAELPARSQLPLILGVLLIGWLVVGIGVGGYLYMESTREAAARQTAAEQVLSEARETYRAGDYGASLQTYGQLIGDWPTDSSIGMRAQAGMLLAQGHLDLSEARYDEARESFLELDRLDVVERDEVRRFIEETEQRRAFAMGMQRLDEAVDAGNFNEARQMLRQWRDLTLTDDEEAKLHVLATKLEGQQAQRRRETVLARAEELMRSGDRQGAIATLRVALDQSPNRQLQQRYDQLVAEQRYNEAIAQARTAENEGNLGEAITAYQRAHDIQPNEQVTAQLNTLRSQVALQDGLRLLSEGRTAEAEAAFTRSLGHRDNVRARDELNRLEGGSRRQTFARAGNEAMHASDFATAVTQYRNALAVEGLADDAALRDKLLDAQLQLELTRGMDALRAGRVDEAERHLREAERMAAQSPAVSSALDQFRTRRQYYQHLAAGDEARSRSEFGDAKRSYRRAQTIIDTPEVRLRLTEADYDQYIAQARTDIAREEYTSARAWLRQAADIEASEEVQQLLRQIQELETGDTQ